MKKFSTNELVEKIKTGIERFIGEMGPCWTKDAFIKLINPAGYSHDLLDPIVIDALRILEQTKTLIYVGKNECVFIVSEEEIAKHFDGEFRKVLVNQVHEIRKKFSV